MLERLNELLAIPLVRAVMIVLGSVVAAFVVETFVQRTLVALTKKTETDLDDKLVAILRRPIFLTAIFAGLYWATAELHVQLGDSARHVTRSAIMTLAILLWSGAIMRTGTLVLTTMSLRAGEGSLVQPSSRPLFDILFKISVAGASVYLVFIAWHLDLTGWLASAGILGVAVGFGAKDTLANLFAGIFILADAPYKVGDFVVLDDGLRGRVTTIGIRSTRILTQDDIEITVPNGVIGNSRIINEAGGPHIKHRLSAQVSVAYGSDIDKVRAVLLESAHGVKNVAEKPAPQVRFTAFGQSGVSFLLQVWVNEPSQKDTVLDALNTRIYKALFAAGIEIPYSKHDVYIKEAPRAADPMRSDRLSAS